MEALNSKSADEESDTICQNSLLPFALLQDRPEWTYRRK